MSQSFAQSEFTHSTHSFFDSWFYDQDYFIIGRFGILYKSSIFLVPDVAIFKGVNAIREAHDDAIDYWDTNKPGWLPPIVIIETPTAVEGPMCDRIARDDLLQKRERFLEMGVKEYFAYDPHSPEYPVWSGEALRGWKRDATGQTVPIPQNEQGRLWSHELRLWLAPDQPYLNFYDVQGEYIRYWKPWHEQKTVKQEEDWATNN